MTTGNPLKSWTCSLALAAAMKATCLDAYAGTPEDIAAHFAADAKAMCDLVPKVYAYYSTRAAHWAEACRQAQAGAASVTTPRQGVTMLEHLVDALWDHHASLGVNTGISPRMVPSGSDIWLEQEGTDVFVTAVRRAGAADHAGIRPGDLVLSIDGLTPQDAARSRIRTGGNDIPSGRMAWALNAAAAGHRGKARRFVLVRGSEKMTFELGDPTPAAIETPVTAHTIGEIGYIRFNDSLGSSDTVAAFDAAVDSMRAVKGWIIDLRDTPSGGNTDVAEPIMGRFVTAPASYQVTKPLREPAYARQVEPRGPWALSGPVIVLAGRWTGSMGEGMAIGFDGMKRGTVVGGPMAGLAGGVETFNLPATDINLRLPAYGLAHVDGTPREHWVPKERVQPDEGSSEDPALAHALEILR